MKALVTGATGFIGGNLVRELVKDGWSVRALVRPQSDTTALEGVEVESVFGDLLDEESLRSAVKGCGSVFHAAALYRLWTPDTGAYHRVNVIGTCNVMEAALHEGVRKVVYTSTASVFGHWNGGPIPNEASAMTLSDMVDGYHRSKYLAEARVLNYRSKGLPVVIVNPTAPVGPWDVKPTPTGKIVLDFLRGKIPAYLNTGLNSVHVRDVCRGHILAHERGRVGERYILGNQNISLKRLFQLLGERVQRRAPSIRLPYWAALGAAYVDQWLSEAFLRREPFVPLAGVKMARRPMFYDCSKAVKELGLPQTPIEDALRDAVDWFRERAKVRIAA